MPKASLSPRRSSRARIAQPVASSSSHPNSLSSGTSSARAERATRSNQRLASPHKSMTPRSHSSHEDSQPSRSQTVEPQSKRTRRKHEFMEESRLQSNNADVAADDEIIEDEETTRCVCGHQDYPGLPVEPTNRPSRPLGTSSTDPDSTAHEPGELFIQCDNCKVWQHGGCVGILDEQGSPENYFCEECRPELHQMLKSLAG